jgi:hypothetical protein
MAGTQGRRPELATAGDTDVGPSTYNMFPTRLPIRRSCARAPVRLTGAARTAPRLRHAHASVSAGRPSLRLVWQPRTNARPRALTARTNGLVVGDSFRPERVLNNTLCPSF